MLISQGVRTAYELQQLGKFSCKNTKFPKTDKKSAAEMQSFCFSGLPSCLSEGTNGV